MAQLVKRRKYPRIRTEKPVHMKELRPEGFEACAKTQNVGLGGCTILSRDPVGQGSPVELIIAMPSKVIKTMGKVVHNRLAPDDTYKVGVEFFGISNADKDALQRFFSDNGFEDEVP